MDSYVCSHCKNSIDRRTILGRNSAWCSHCHDVVQLSCFQTQGWILGVVLVLAAQLHLAQLG